MKKLSHLISILAIIGFFSLYKFLENHLIIFKNERNTGNKILIVTIALGDQWYKPLVKANRENYCKKHGYSLLFLEKLTVPLKGVHINWSKITEGLKILDKKAPYKWIFFADLDLFIMNINQRIENLIFTTIQANKREKSNIDFILAKDGNGFNFGSVLVRNGNYSRFIFQEIWNRRDQKDIPNISMWFEQAIFTYLMRTSDELTSHVAVASQKSMNAYSNSRHGVHYKYVDGDFILHFPGPHMKKDISEYVSKLLKLQPELKAVSYTEKVQ
jgi:mannan polymerase II complex MNN11 subunit